MTGKHGAMYQQEHDTAITLAAMVAKRWELVKLKGKKPVGLHWEVTTDPAVVADWLRDGFNLGTICHERTGLAVLDPDKIEWADMVDALEQPCLPWVITGSGRLHYYVAWAEDLPAKLAWGGMTLGEIQRGPGQQQVVMPPSRHPATGRPYTWITEALGGLCCPIDPVADPLPALPPMWLSILRHDLYLRRARQRGAEST
jgi:hypothetical protein